MYDDVKAGTDAEKKKPARPADESNTFDCHGDEE